MIEHLRRLREAVASGRWGKATEPGSETGCLIQLIFRTGKDESIDQVFAVKEVLLRLVRQDHPRMHGLAYWSDNIADEASVLALIDKAIALAERHAD